MSNKIKDLKELATFVLNLANGISASLADGKLEWKDAWHFKDAAISALPAFNGIQNVDDQFFSMEEADHADFNAHIAEKLNLQPGDKKIEEVAEMVLKQIVGLNKIIASLVGAKAPEAQA